MFVLLGVCLLTLYPHNAGWFREHRWSTNDDCGADGNSYYIGSAPGRFFLAFERSDEAYPGDEVESKPSVDKSGFFLTAVDVTIPENADALPEFCPTKFGFSVLNSDNNLSSHSREQFHAFIIPNWLPLVAAGFFVVVCYLKWVGDFRRQRFQLCRGCGYDLRATPDRCPECGRTFDRFAPTNRE